MASAQRALRITGWLVGVLVIAGTTERTATAQTTQPAPTTESAGAGAAATATRPDGDAPEYAHPRPIPLELLKPKRPDAVILPSVPPDEGLAEALRSGGLVAPVPPVERLLPEGFTLARRPGQFTRDDQGVTFAPEDVAGTPKIPPLRVLPNRQLALVDRLLDQGADGETFLATGRVTEFLGRNYLLLEDLSSQTSPAPPAPAANGSKSEPKAAPPKTEPKAEPAEPGEPGRVPEADEIISGLLSRGTPRPVAVPPGTTPATTNGAGAPGASATEGGPAAVLPEGTLIPEFPARLIKSDEGWTIVRESPGDRPTASSYAILPSRLLEVMMSATAGGTRSVVLLVSGQLTEYRGNNYFLVRKVLIRRDQGNIR